MKVYKNILADIVSLLEGFSLGLAYYRTVYQIESIRDSSLKVTVSDTDPRLLLISLAGATLLVFFMRQRLRGSYKGLDIPYPEMSFERALLPLLFAVPAFLFPGGIYTALLFIPAVSISALRYVASLPRALKFNFKFRLPVFAAIIFFLAVLVYETLIQQKALDSFILNYSDWGIYTNAVDNTLKGRFFYSNELGRNYMGHHFMPGAFLVLLPVVAIFRSAFAIFVFNSLVLYAGAFVIYFLAVKKNIPRNYALALAVVYCLAPSLSNMNLSLFYGFHPVYMTMPLIALFFLFLERKNFVAASLIFVFSLSIKETVAIFWIGTGAVLFFGGNRRAGGFIVLISIVYFLLITLFIMPAISGQKSYEFISRFSHLGWSFSEIALSPFTHPGLVLQTLFRPQNVIYISVLLLPVFIVAFNSYLLLGGVLIMLFSMLQTSSQVCHLGTQYQSEALMLLYLSAVYGFARCRERNGDTWLLRFLLTGIRRGAAFSVNVPTVLVVAIFLSSIISFCFFGKFYLSKTSDVLQWTVPRYCNEMECIRNFVPEGASLTATSEFGANFIFRNDVFLIYNRPLKDFVLINLSDKFSQAEDLENLRAEVICSGEYKLLKEFNIGNCIVLLFGKKAEGEQYSMPRPGIAPIPLEMWRQSECVSSGIPEIEYKIFVSGRNSEGRPDSLKLIFRIMKKIDFDFDLELYDFESPREEDLIGEYSFGGGIFPAYLAEVGEAYTIDYPLTEKLNGNIAVRIKPKPRPDPQLLHPMDKKTH